MDQPIRQIDLIEGGNVVKQGDHFRLKFRMKNAEGEVIDATGKTVTLQVANHTGVIAELTGTSDEDGVSFDFDEDIGYGKMDLEIKVTDGSSLLQKYPAKGFWQLKIEPSLDDAGVGGIIAVKASVMLDRISSVETASSEAVTKANEAEATADSIRQEVNAVVNRETDTDAMSRQAAVNAAGVDKGNLKTRLDEEYTQVTDLLAQTMKFQSQTDFVDLVKQYSSEYTKMLFKRAGTNRYQILLNNDVKGVVYQFIKDANDDFIKIDACYTGIGEGVVSTDFPTTEDISGTWNTSTSSWYTSQPGATFTLSVEKGSKLMLRVQRESRGGLWSIVVDGDTENPIPISTYNATSGVTELLIIDGLDPNVSHEIVGTFMGDDPSNPPSSTPSRGYIRLDAGNGTLIGYDKIATPTKMVLADGSNKEMAFTIIKDGSFEWLPDHGTGTAFNVQNPKFIIDGLEKNVSSIAINEVIEISTFELKQNFNGFLPSLETNLCEVVTSHKIKKEGVIVFTGKLKALTQMEISGYPLMLPAFNNFANEFVTGILNRKTNTQSEQYDYFTEEKDKVYSGAIVSPTNKEIVGAGTLLNPLITYRSGKTGRPPAEESLFLWNRATKPKMYWHSLKNLPLSPGDSYGWAFKMAVADIDNVYDMVTA